MEITDHILSILKYFAKFVSPQVLNCNFKQPNHSKWQGYSELQAELTNLPANYTIEAFQRFIFSTNPEFVSDSIKNTKGFLLFVEYNKIGLNPNTENGFKQNLAITVAHEFTKANNDSLNETLISNATSNLLLAILQHMANDMRIKNPCDTLLFNFPAEIYPIEPTQFYDHIGWMAKVETYKNTF